MVLSEFQDSDAEKEGGSTWSTLSTSGNICTKSVLVRICQRSYQAVERRLFVVVIEGVCK
jgi:hypothetical protein